MKGHAVFQIGRREVQFGHLADIRRPILQVAFFSILFKVFSSAGET